MQPSAQVQKDLRPRDSRTFARSNVMGNDDAADKMNDGGLHKPISTRNEGKWGSNVFGEAEANRITRKNLEPSSIGKGGLYGERDEREDWQKPKPIAAVISMKEKP